MPFTTLYGLEAVNDGSVSASRLRWSIKDNEDAAASAEPYISNGTGVVREDE